MERKGDANCVKACVRFVAEGMAPFGSTKETVGTLSTDMSAEG